MPSFPKSGEPVTRRPDMIARPAARILAGLVVSGQLAALEPVWIEGEDAVRSEVARHPWYHGEVKRGELSGGEFLSHFSKDREGSAEYAFELGEPGEYELWIRANPVQSRMQLRIDEGEEQAVDFKRRQAGNTNIAADGKPDLRFLAWCQAGRFRLAAGAHRLRVRFTSENSHHGALDCLVLAPAGFRPSGILKPDEIARQRDELRRGNEGWVPWLADPGAEGERLLDLRHLNERVAGEKGGIVAKGPDFAFRKTGEKVRFWAVNGPPHELRGEELAACARRLAALGVNLVRLHGRVFDESTGELDRERLGHLREVVAAMKREGIYSHLSIYFPLWMRPKDGPGWREGYDGGRHPFALLFFEPEFQALHRSWLAAALDGLIDEPAVFGVELVNEDSFFFWTFAENNIPEPQLRKLERRFGEWAAARHGSVDAAVEAWGGMTLPRDGGGRLGFRPLWNLVHERRPRDRDTAAFLLETQRGFYEDTTRWLRDRGFRGMATASNWHTADAAILGPLEKYSYTPGDFIDRHGYFGCGHEGDQAAWSLREGHLYRDRSALRFDPEKPGDGRSFSNPVMDPCYNGMPSMISETTFNRPNRHRTEAPWVYAAYGALQGSDAVVHFALDSADWSVKPGFFMQPWTLMSPTQAGQFPAAAMIFRKGLVREGPPVAEFSLSLEDALALEGSPLAPPANLDELRKAGVPGEAGARGGLDPLVYFVGRTSLRIGAGEKSGGGRPDLGRWIDRERARVTSAGGELVLDYGRGLLGLRAPAAQGAVGDLSSGGTMSFPDLEIRSPMELGAIVAVSLDGRPLATSRRILLQAMSEEKASGFATEPAADGRRRIVSLGRDPWLIRELQGSVAFKRPDAAALRVRALDIDGRPVGELPSAAVLKIRPDVAYYLLSAEGR